MALNLPTIRGNHERQLLTLPRERMGASDAFAADAISAVQRDWLASLPATLEPADDVFCCHGTPHARYALLTRPGREWQIELRAIAYDWEAAARRAGSNGRGDWAGVLRSGRVGRWERQAQASPPQPG